MLAQTPFPSSRNVLRLLACAGILVSATTACGGGGSGGGSSPPPNSPVPTLSSISPATAAAGAPALTLVATGSSFVSTSTLQWNGAALSTTYVSATQLSASVPASDLAAAGNQSVTVVTPAPGGGTSSAATFTITATNPAPALTSISPTGATAGSGALTLTANGSNFAPACTIDWNGTPLATTYVNSSQVTASVPASDLASTGTDTVTVVNPTPGGGTSSAASFTVTSAVAGAPQVRQCVTYNATTGAENSNVTSASNPHGLNPVYSANWIVNLNGVLAGSAIYVVGVWPNCYAPAQNYPTMEVIDGQGTYSRLGRLDDTSAPPSYWPQIGCTSIGHWVSSNVAAGNHVINMTPAPPNYTTEDIVGILACEITNVSASPVQDSNVTLQAAVAPGADAIRISATSTSAYALMVGLTFDEIDYAAPTVPLVGTGYTDLAGQLWPFTANQTGVLNYTARGQWAVLPAAGSHTMTFTTEENGLANGGNQEPNYLTVTAIFK